jgi:hypothetical protein
MVKLSDLTDAEKNRFWFIVRESYRKGLNAKVTQDILAQELRKVFGQRMIQRYLEKVRGEDVKTTNEAAEANPGASTLTKEVNGSEEVALELRSSKVITLEDALRKGEVDLTRWDVERYTLNSWEVGVKGPDGKVVTSPLWQVKVWLKAKKGWNPSEFRALLKADLEALAPAYPRVLQVQEVRIKQPILAELSIFDAHFGKLAWSPESGQDYDLKICQQRYKMAAHDLLERCKLHQPERILYVVGNDFFHTDHKGLTTNGTPQDCDGRWQKAFRVGVDCCIRTAEEAAHIAPVEILVVPGNHDREKAFCLGEVLAARFHNSQRILVTNTPDLYQYFRWGKVLLGFVHGDNHGSDKRRGLLPQTMATDRPVDWSETVWREWHLGHFHSETEDVWKYRTTEHVRNVAVRVLPSLSSTDAWHRQQDYCSVLAAELHLYHRDKGRFGIYTHQVEG